MTIPKRVLTFFSLLFWVLPVFAQPSRIGGADTLIYLGQRFVERYQMKRPELHFRVFGKEQSAAMADNLDILQIEGSAPAGNRLKFPIAVQSVVLYVNKSNHIKELSVAQVRAIFLGRITNWKDLGGPDRTIALYAGESTTGTLPFFEDTVLHGEEPYPFEGKSNTHALLEVIASNPAAIGYGTVDSNPGVRAIAIKAGLTSGAVEPTIQNIRSQQYPITRHIYWAINPNASRAVKDLCAWVLASDGQIVAEAAGFEPLLPEERNAGLFRLGLKEPGQVSASR